MASKVNPQNDSAVITARYFSGYERKYFILPEKVSADQRKEYLLTIKDELTTRLKDQINIRILPHMKMKE